jgi:hypothetical protein
MLQENVLQEDMLQENVWTVGRTTIALRFPLEDAQEVHIDEMLSVLERAAEDDSFIAQLTYFGEQALQAYRLTWEEKAALLSGDIAWIEARLGKLDARQRTWLDCRLQQEIW